MQIELNGAQLGSARLRIWLVCPTSDRTRESSCKMRS